MDYILTCGSCGAKYRIKPLNGRAETVLSLYSSQNPARKPEKRILCYCGFDLLVSPFNDDVDGGV